MLRRKSHLFTTTIAATLITISLSGCSDAEILSRNETKKPISFQATPEPSVKASVEPVSVKLTDPITISVKTSKERFTRDEDIEIKIDFGFEEFEKLSKSGELIIEENGPLKILGNKEFRFDDIKNVKDKSITLKVSRPIPDSGLGDIHVKYKTYDESGKEACYRMESLGYYIFDTGIMFGHDQGTLGSKYIYEQLDIKVKEGKLTKEEAEFEFSDIQRLRREQREQEEANNAKNKN